MSEDVSKETQQTLLKTLAELGGGQFRPEDDIVSEGKRLILPEGMSMQRAIDYLAERLEADEEETQFTRTFRYRPWDGAVCTNRALKEVFGIVGTKMTFMQPPQMIDIPVGPDEHESVPWGAFTVPGLDRTTIYTAGENDAEYGTIFRLVIEAPRKYRAQAEGIFMAVAHRLQTDSIYRGKAFDGKETPEFLDLSGVDPEKVIYSAETIVQLDANIWSVLRYRKELETVGISRKRSALLYGPYGTGKTLGGFLTAQVAVESGWTFIYARPGKDDVGSVMQTARLYQPACVFFEDLDTVADPAETTADGATRLLDVFDGITAKGTELMVVLTTNHPDRIHKGMLRPGRLDAVIEIGPLDEDGVARVVKTTVPAGSLAEVIEWDDVFDSMQGFLPAYIKEAADRAYRYALARTGKPDGIVLQTSDLKFAADGLRPQLELMEDASEHRKSDTVGTAFKELVRQGHIEAVVADFEDDSYVGRSLTDDARDAAARRLNS